MSRRTAALEDEAEVEELGGAARRREVHHHVARLEVAVNEAGAVRGVDGVGEALQDPTHALGRLRALLLDELPKVDAADELDREYG